MSKTDEQILVSRLQEGDENALSSLYDLYSSSLYGLCLKIVRDELIAQDVLQDSFINIWKKIKSYDNKKGSLFTWMLNICRNKSIDALRKIDRERTGKNQIDESGVYMKESSININKIGMNDLMANLPEEQQIIIEYLYYKGYTQKETAEHLDIPLGTVKTRARMALLELRKYFNMLIAFWI